MTKEERYYRNLSEVYQIGYNDQIKVAETLMVISGITAEMISDLLKYREKNGNTETYKKSLARVMLMESKFGDLSQIQSDNYSMMLINRRLLARVANLESEIAALKNQDKNQKDLDNSEIPNLI